MSTISNPNYSDCNDCQIQLHKISQYNVAGLKNKSFFTNFWHDLAEFDIFSLTETWLTSEFQFPSVLNNFEPIQSFAIKNNIFGRPSGGLILGYNTQKVKINNVLKISSHFIAITANYHMFKNIVIIICYFPPSEIHNSQYREFLDFVTNLNSVNLIIMGDLNARVGCLDNIFISDSNDYIDHKSKDNFRNQRGKLLIEFLVSNNLILLNGSVPGDEEGNFTFFNEKGASVIDLIIVSNSVYPYITHFKTIPKLGSDHLPVVATLWGPAGSSKNSDKIFSQSLISRWTDAEGSIFVEEMEHFFAAHPDTDPNEFISVTRKVAENTNLLNSRKSFKTFQPSSHSKTKWFDQDCHESKHKLKEILKILRKNSNQTNFNSYKTSLREYKKLCTLKKNSYLEKINSELSSCKDSKSFWQIIKNFKRVNYNQNSIEPSKWCNYFSTTFKSNITLGGDSDCQLLSGNYFSFSDQYLDGDITMQELQGVVKNLKCGKAPGWDSLKPEFFKYLGSSSLTAICNTFNKIFSSGSVPPQWILITINPIYKKGDVTNPANYRPISLIPVITKIFTSILNNRLIDWLNAHNILLEEQAGFRKGYSCLDQIFVLNCLISSKLKKKRGKLYSVFVDFKGAFDNIDHLLLWSELRKINVSTKFIRIIRDMYSKAYAKVRTSNGLTEPFKINSGVLQGEVLSPILFSLFLNELVNRLNNSKISDISLNNGEPLNILLYADDAVILADSPINLQKKLHILEKFCSDFNLTVNTAKTKAMIFRKGGRLSRHDKFYYQNCNLEVVSGYTYLGVPFSSSGSFSSAKNHFINKSISATNAMWPILTGGKIGSPAHWFRLFHSLVLSVLSYGSPVWSVTFFNHLERIQNFFIRKLFNLSMYTPGYIMRLELGQSTISVIIIKLILKFWIRVLKMPDDRLTKKAYLYYYYNQSDSLKFNWTLNIKSIIDNSGFSFVWLSQDHETASKHLPHIITSYINQYTQLDMISMNNSIFNSHYKLIKYNFFIEDYITSSIDFSSKRILFQIRLNQESLYFEGKIFKIHPNQFCQFCNMEKHETWEHIFFECPTYDFYRAKYLSSLSHFRSNFYNFLSLKHGKFYLITNFIKSAQRLNRFLLESLSLEM